MTNTAQNDLIDAVSAIVADAPKKKPAAKKPAKKAAAAPAHIPALDSHVAAAIKKAAEAEKAEAPQFKGFNVKADTDLKALESDLKALSEAVTAISRKDADLLSSYLVMGKGASAIAPLFASTKLYGQFLAQEIPATASLDPALRSNCKWLYEALNVKGHEAADLLTVLGVNRIDDFKSGNPTVIKREYKAMQKASEAVIKAKEMGLDCETSEQAEKEVKAALNAEKAEAEKKEAAALKRAINAYIKKTKETETPLDIALADFEALIMSALFDPKEDTLATLKDLTKGL